MITLLFRTDVHVADHNPASWKGDYRSEVLSCLEQIGDIARENDVDAVIDGGDFFHVKAASRNSHALVREVVEIHKSYPCPVYGIEGNHDLRHNNHDSLDSQPLGVLYAAGVFHHLRDHTFQDQFGTSVRVVGTPYKAGAALSDFQGIHKGSEDYLVSVAHILATENPVVGSASSFIGDTIFKYSDLVWPGCPDFWCFGHWHKDQGVCAQYDGDRRVHFVNQGSVSRGALNADNLERVPKVALLKFETSLASVDLVELKVSEAAEVFDIQKKSRQVRRDAVIEQFITRLVKDGVGDSMGTPEDAIAKLEFARDVQEGALEYLERARSERKK